MPVTSERKHRRIFWFVPRFSLRTFLIVIVLLGTGLGIWVERTRRQMRVCEAIKAEAIGEMHYWFDRTPKWLQFLPQSWLDAGGGHWCHSVDCVDVSSNSLINPMTDVEARTLYKRRFELVAQLPNVSELDIRLESMPGDLQELTEMFSPLTKMHGLEQITINVQIPNPRMLEALPKLPRLTWLSLDRNGVNELSIQLKQLLKFPVLEHLKFSNLSVEDNDLTPLAKLTHLKHVDAQNLVVRASEMECLAGHPTLENMEITSYAYTDDMFKILASMPNLDTINASQSLITDQGLSYLANASHLEMLYLADATITDEGFTKLGSCKSLQYIVCFNCKLTDAIGPTLARLPNLKSIGLGGTLTTPKLLDYLAGNKTLREDADNVDVGDRRISVDQLLGFFDGAEEYSAYNTWRCASRIFGGGGNVFVDDFQVNLSGIRGVHGRFGCLASSNRISDLNLRDTDIDDSDLKILSPLLQHLMLDISDTNCTADGILYLAQQTSPLALTLGPMEKQDEVWKAISQMHLLEELVLRGQWPLSNEARSSLLRMSNLERLTMADCEIDEAFAGELCKLPQLSTIKCKNLDWDEPHIEALRTGCSLASLSMPSIRNEADIDCFSSTSISSLSAAGVALSSSALAKIAQMNGVRKLDLSNTGITDSQLAALAALPDLEVLDLSNNPITDAGLATIPSMSGVRNIKLANTKITNQGLNQLLTSTILYTLDVAGTSITSEAWNNIDSRPLSWMVCGNLSGLPDILTAMPIDLLPESMYVGRQNFKLTAHEIKAMRSDNPESSHGNLMFAPETLDVWPPERILVGKDRQLTLNICGTSRVADILKLADKHYVSDVQIVSEQLNTAQTIDFPKTTRNVVLQSCTVDTQTIQSLAKCQWLRSIQFDWCDLKDCDLAPLLAMPMLCELSVGNAKLSSAQKAVLQQLRPSLIEREQMAHLRFIGPLTTGLAHF